MAPSAFVMLDTMPMTANGKIDRNALPMPEGMGLEAEVEYVEPQTQAQRIVAAIIGEVLHVEKVGIHYNFFDMGAHSLIMVQAHAKLRKAFNKEFPLLKVFENPTVSSLAKYLSDEKIERDSFNQGQSRGEKRKNRTRQKPVRRGKGETTSIATD
jgi:acyl carrier protein